MSRYLVNFGDSWAHGTRHVRARRGLNTYASHLSNLTNRQLIDMSVSSTSNSHMVLQFQQFIKQYYQPDNDYLAVFFITAQARQLRFNDQGVPLEISPSANSSFIKDPVATTYYRDIYTDHLGEFNLNIVLIALQSMSNHYHIDDRYLLGWQHPNLWPEIDLNRFYFQSQSTAMELLGGTDIIKCGHDGNLNFIPGDGHPSLDGHGHIAQALYQWIQKN